MTNTQPKHIAIGTAIVAFILIGLEYTVFAVIIMILGVYMYKKTKEKHTSNSTVEQLKTEAQAYIDAFKKDGGLPVIETQIFLEDNEHAFLEAEVTLYETRAVRHHKGGGAGIRIAKGVSIGGYEGRSESKQEWKEIDTGTLLLTNNRVLFVGHEENRIIPLKKIFNTEVDGLGFIISHQKKNIYFENTNPVIWTFAIDILRQVVGEKDIPLVRK